MGNGLENVAQKLLAPKPSRIDYRVCRDIPLCGQKSEKKSKKSTLKLTLAAWNVRTLLDNNVNDRPQPRTALVATELRRNGIDIAALSETRFADEGSLEEVGGGYHFFWKGLPEADRRMHGVAFAIRSSLLKLLPGNPQGINERLISLRVPLRYNRYLSIIGVYAPTLVAEEFTKDNFYNELEDTIRAVPRADKLVILGDFNARVGTSHQLWEGVLGTHGVGKCNSNGLRLLSLCAEHGLAITNTMFQLRAMHKTTWMHPRSKQWHLLDYVLVRQCDLVDVMITRVMRGADCGTDHRMVRSKLKLQLRRPTRNTAPARKLNVAALRSDDKKDELKTLMAQSITVPVLDGEILSTELLTDKWEEISRHLRDCSESVLGIAGRRHRDWFDESEPLITPLLEERNRLNAKYLRSRTAANHANLAAARSHIQRQLRELKNRWWASYAAEIQGYADVGNQQEFYSSIKQICGPKKAILTLSEAPAVRC